MRGRSRSRTRREPSPVRAVLTACGVSAAALLVGGAGLFAITSSGTTTSLTRIGLAAGILAFFCSAVGGLVLPHSFRTPGRRWVCALAVPVLLGVGTAGLVGLRSGLAAGVLAALPWLVGALLGGAVSPFLPDLSWHSRARRREERSSSW